MQHISRWRWALMGACIGLVAVAVTMVALAGFSPTIDLSDRDGEPSFIKSAYGSLYLPVFIVNEFFESQLIARWGCVEKGDVLDLACTGTAETLDHIRGGVLVVLVLVWPAIVGAVVGGASHWAATRYRKVTRV